MSKGYSEKEKIFVLQNRWEIKNRHIVYYGIRKAPYTFKNSLRLPQRTLKKLRLADGSRTLAQLKPDLYIKKLIKEGILVPKENYRPDKSTYEEASFCKNCTANDYMIPGLETDENGLCPMCVQKEKLKKLKAVLPEITTVPDNRKGEYDLALFYTGGKDSSFLLYYFAVVLKKRVLCLTWEIEYMSENARQSIENAKKIVENADFLIKKVDKEVMKRIYTEHYRLAGNTCMCPSLAYVLFYPILTEKNIPYLVLGNEPSQMQNLLFNNISPKIAFRPKIRAIGRFLWNSGRILTFKKPLAAGQEQTYLTVRTLAKGTFFGKSGEGKYHNEQVRNICKALASEKEFTENFRKAVKKSYRNGRIPRLAHVDLSAISDGYKWGDVKTLLKEKIGWIDCVEADKGLHTSCNIEKCKEYTQFQRFRAKESRLIPFSAIEMAIAVRDGQVSREEGLRELETHSGFFAKPDCYEEMLRPLK